MKSSRAIQIQAAKHVGDHALHLVFSDGREQTVDFEPFLSASSHPEIRKFLIPKNFKKFKLTDGELMWGDFDLIFPIADLYENAISHAPAVSKRRFSSGSR